MKGDSQRRRKRKKNIKEITKGKIPTKIDLKKKPHNRWRKTNLKHVQGTW